MDPKNSEPKRLNEEFVDFMSKRSRHEVPHFASQLTKYINVRQKRNRAAISRKNSEMGRQFNETDAEMRSPHNLESCLSTSWRWISKRLPKFLTKKKAPVRHPPRRPRGPRRRKRKSCGCRSKSRSVSRCKCRDSRRRSRRRRRRR